MSIEKYEGVNAGRSLCRVTFTSRRCVARETRCVFQTQRRPVLTQTISGLQYSLTGIEEKRKRKMTSICMGVQSISAFTAVLVMVTFFFCKVKLAVSAYALGTRNTHTHAHARSHKPLALPATPLEFLWSLIGVSSLSLARWRPLHLCSFFARYRARLIACCRSDVRIAHRWSSAC